MSAAGERFPFGAPSTRRPSRPPTNGPAAVAVVGVYPSALHVRWDLPAWAVKQRRLAARIGALAVDVEPCVFWDGTDPEPDELVRRWRKAVGFTSGEEPGSHGHVAPHMNGTTGRAVTKRVLQPLGASPAATFFTDVVPRFFVKTGTPARPQQADRIRDVYEPFARAARLPSATLPARPSPAQVVTEAAHEEGDRLRRELAAADAPVVVTVGEEARAVLARIVDEAAGAPLAPLRRDDPGYGEEGSLRLDGYRARWYALTHPGNRHPSWAHQHEQWMERQDSH